MNLKNIKTWQYVSVLGGLAIILIYLKRRNIKKFINSNETIRKLIAENAIKWIGTQEIGNNNGFANAEFQKMMKQIGWVNGDQWCMWFAKAVHINTFPNEKNVINAILGGNSQSSFNNAEKDSTGTYSVIKSGTPIVGDIAIWRKDAGSGHAGVVVDVDEKNGNFTTVEGNTDDPIFSNEVVAKKVHALIYGGKYSPGSSKVLRGFIRKNSII